jgi:DNA-directed RNA polymerase subunit RPC12/RpoP
MNWRYYGCNRCGHAIRTISNNPSPYLACAACGNHYFNGITKVEYDKARRKAPLQK